jgi:hypothetical protein
MATVAHAPATAAQCGDAALRMIEAASAEARAFIKAGKGLTLAAVASVMHSAVSSVLQELKEEAAAALE